MSEPLTSILIPCYNASPWVEWALRSSMKQSWPHKEIILVDDGSTDGSYEIAQEFESTQCLVLRQEHTGASAARNRAFSESQGELIQYLDADDLLVPEKIEHQVGAMRDVDAGTLSFGSVIHFFDLLERGDWVVHQARLSPRGADPREFLTDLWSGAGPLEMVQPGQFLTPRGLIEKAGPWDETLSVDDDGEFFARVLLRASRVVAVPEAYCYYRKFRSGGNLSASGDRKSSMRAAQMKSSYLLECSPGLRPRQAVQRLMTREVVEAYPAFRQVSREGLDFLFRLGLQRAERLEGSPWFLRLYPVIGWRATRWLQWHLGRWKERIARSLMTTWSRLSLSRNGA